MTVAENASTTPNQLAPPSGPDQPGSKGRLPAVVRSPRLRWLVGGLLVAALVLLTILVVLGTANRQQTDDPRSSTGRGAGALGQLLRDVGVDIVTTTDPGAAAKQAGPATTLVVANADRLSPESARTLLDAGAGRTILLRPRAAALTAFGVQASVAAPVDGTPAPACAVPGPATAGDVTFTDMRASYRPSGPNDFSCYPAASGGFAYLGAATASGRPVQIVAGGIDNDDLDGPGNAAYAMSVFGSQPTVVWLMAADEDAPNPATRPTLLPLWWQIAVVQAIIALVVVGIWRGRRLGPILSERLPVKVRAAETVEGHGRLYFRLSARDRAAEALRSGLRHRLSRAYGHSADPTALSAAIAARTGRDAGQVRRLLDGPPPDTDDALVGLARDLDRLEQEARQL